MRGHTGFLTQSVEEIAFLPCWGLAKMGSSGLPSRAGPAREGVPRVGEAGVGSSSLVTLLLRKSLSISPSTNGEGGTWEALEPGPSSLLRLQN